MFAKAIISSILLMPTFSLAASLDGAALNLFWGIPFALILLSIALGPVLLSKIWHHHFGKITLILSLLFLIPFSLAFGLQSSIHLVAHALIAEYIPFILLLLSLYTISGGILVSGSLNGSAKLNTGILAIGTCLASIMGTTGAAMLLIRPLLRANQHRKHRVHVVVFFIFLVANIGGGLTPLGDPPLFLGFLKGVSFGWTVQHMFAPVLITSIILLTVFYYLDKHYFSQPDEIINKSQAVTEHKRCQLLGKWNFLLLGGVIAAVLLSGIWKPEHPGINILGTHYLIQNLARDAILLALAIISLKITPASIRKGNEFNWEPILEVGKLFAGIFITISPVLAILQAGEKGALHSIIALVHTQSGTPINSMYFWMSGLLSGFLDNAPTYLVFFNMAGGDAQALMQGEPLYTLLAISMGSVFMGALSYIGNAPNFMVKSIAEHRNVPMPSFFGYMVWSVSCLIPIFILHTLIFFVFKIF